MTKVIFIDHGNMFRSRVAEALFNKFTKDDFRAGSYGTHVLEQGYQDLKICEHKGTEPIINELKKYDIDISNNRCKQLKEEFLEKDDKIVVMAEREYVPDWLNKFQYEHWEIPNPEYVDGKVAKEIVDLIKIKVLKLIDKIK